MFLKNIRKHADQIGIVGSTLCLIHCLAVPVIALLSTGTAQLGHHHELGNDALFIIICFIAVFFAARATPFRSIKVAFWVFMVMFGLGLWLGRLSHELEWLEYFAHAGTVGLIITHIFNIRLTRKHASCQITVSHSH